MSSQIDQETSRMVLLRMRKNGKSAAAIIGVLKKVNPGVDEDVIILFMADCIKRPPDVKTRRTPRSSVSDSDPRTFESSSCTSSSTKSNC